MNECFTLIWRHSISKRLSKYRLIAKTPSTKLLAFSVSHLENIWNLYLLLSRRVLDPQKYFQWSAIPNKLAYLQGKMYWNCWILILLTRHPFKLRKPSSIRCNHQCVKPKVKPGQISFMTLTHRSVSVRHVQLFLKLLVFLYNLVSLFLHLLIPRVQFMNFLLHQIHGGLHWAQ